MIKDGDKIIIDAITRMDNAEPLYVFNLKPEQQPEPPQE
jgi:hypothetical protein